MTASPFQATQTSRGPQIVNTLPALEQYARLDAVRALIAPQRLTAVVDVGANPIDGEPPYREMLSAGMCSVVGFEPQPEALARLEARKGPHESYLPHALGDGAEHVLRITDTPGMTSIFEPDPRRLALFNGFGVWGRVTNRVPVSTTRLDDVDGLGEVDLLKIDVQGAELMVFEGGRERLASAVAVHTEVSFMPLYEGQPTFGDIDSELRSQGFVPHAFAAVKRWTIAPMVVNGDFRLPLNQLLEADVVYVRDFADPDAMSDEQLRQLALIADVVYRSPDLAHHCLGALALRGAADVGATTAYLSTLG